MKELKLSNHHQCAIVDDEDYERLSKFNWTVILNKVDYIYRRINSKTKLSLAADIMNRHGVKFDHIDHNPYNNTKNNLRECTASQNCFNTRKTTAKTSSKYKGVCFVKRGKRWKACITIYGQYKFLGTYKLEIEAAKAYNKAALELFKEFACLNKNENGEVL